MTSHFPFFISFPFKYWGWTEQLRILRQFIPVYTDIFEYIIIKKTVSIPFCIFCVTCVKPHSFLIKFSVHIVLNFLFMPVWTLPVLKFYVFIWAGEEEISLIPEEITLYYLPSAIDWTLQPVSLSPSLVSCRKRGWLMITEPLGYAPITWQRGCFPPIVAQRQLGFVMLLREGTSLFSQVCCECDESLCLSHTLTASCFCMQTIKVAQRTPILALGS